MRSSRNYAARGGEGCAERVRENLEGEKSFPFLRHQFFLLGRSFTLVIGGGELVKTFRSGDEEVSSRFGRVLLQSSDDVIREGGVGVFFQLKVLVALR